MIRFLKIFTKPKSALKIFLIKTAPLYGDKMFLKMMFPLRTGYKLNLKNPRTFNEKLQVDLYNVNGKIYFGELTFFHFSGFVPFEPAEWDLKLGEMINIVGYTQCNPINQLIINKLGGGRISLSFSKSAA